MSKYVKNAFLGSLNAVLPPRCAITGEIVPQHGFLSSTAWAGIDFIAEPFCSVCGFPFDIAVEQGSVCGACLEARPPFDLARAAVRYNESSKALILAFKHGDRTEIVSSFVPWLKRAGQEALAGAELLAPVPLHRWRLLNRRYNQAALIAGALARETQIPVSMDLLVRFRPTPSQGHLKASERQQNVKGAFILNPRYRDAVKGKKIVLIDDVYTTGSTVRECTKVLKKAGADSVCVLTLARVIRTGF